MRTNGNATLQQMQSTAEQLGYTTTVAGPATGNPYETISVHWEDEAEEEQYLEFTLYPVGAELDGSVFVQIYAEYPFPIPEQHRGRVVTALPTVNNKLPLGHFDLSPDQETLYFRYVAAVPTDCTIAPGYLSDLLDMCIWAYTGYRDAFHTLSTADS